MEKIGQLFDYHKIILHYFRFANGAVKKEDFLSYVNSLKAYWNCVEDPMRIVSNMQK